MEQKYSVYIEKTALKALKKIDAKDRERIRNSISFLTYDPRPTGVRKLVANDSLYRLRVGGYRILYQIKDEKLLVLVVRVALRGEVYKNL